MILDYHSIQTHKVRAQARVQKMAFFILKVTTADKWIRPPIVANFSSEDEAIQAVQALVDEDCTIEIKGVRSDVMLAAFGNIPEGCASFRHDWIWDGATPKPY